MDVFVVAQAVLRRWWVVVPTLALTAAAVFFILSRVEPHYEARASILLTTQDLAQADASAQALQPVPLSAAIVAEIVQGDDMRSRLAEQDASADYTIEVAGDDAILRVRAQDTRSGTVVPTVEAVIGAIDDTIAARGDDLRAGGEPLVEVLSRPGQERSTTVVGADGESLTVYEATGAVAIPGLAAGTNPFLPNSGTLRVLQEIASSPEARAAIAANGRGSTFELQVQPRDAAPILYIESTGSDPEGVMNTLHSALAFLNSELAQRQEAVGAPPATWIRLDPLSMPAGATARFPELRRPLLTVVGLGLIASVSLAILVDNFIAYRRKRSRRSFDIPPGKGDSAPTRREQSERIASG